MTRAVYSYILELKFVHVETDRYEIYNQNIVDWIIGIRKFGRDIWKTYSLQIAKFAMRVLRALLDVSAENI